MIDEAQLADFSELRFFMLQRDCILYFFKYLT